MEEGRKSKRLATNLKAKYFLKERKGEGHECTIINLSHGGVGLELYTPEKLVADSILTLEIFSPKALEPIIVEGKLMWVKEGQRDSIGGIEMTSQMDKDKLEVLIITLGL